MFTGIIEELGTVAAVEPRAAGSRLTVRCHKVLEDAEPGVSISVNGVCLTASELAASTFAADVSPESLNRSNLGELRPGSLVNLERPLSPTGRLGGHIVQGHVDATGEVVSQEELGDGNWWLTVRYPASIDPFLVEKGSVAIDGISLTIAAIDGETFSVTVIPHTYRHTTLSLRPPGSLVNLETDIIAKHVAKLLGRTERPAGLTVARLKEMGF